MSSKNKKSIYKATEQGWQYCKECKQDTWHTPKMGLVHLNKRLCTRCNTSNELIDYICECEIGKAVSHHPDCPYMNETFGED
jgi:hypothetical protein